MCKYTIPCSITITCFGDKSAFELWDTICYTCVPVCALRVPLFLKKSLCQKVQIDLGISLVFWVSVMNLRRLPWNEDPNAVLRLPDTTRGPSVGSSSWAAHRPGTVHSVWASARSGAWVLRWYPSPRASNDLECCGVARDRVVIDPRLRRE